ncbi:hypothetical protein PR202_gn00423 [Eleusine coracana subsp. coracana]|uniref:NAD(+) synthase (glutamine-hydrolyzing) n=1 Tax=Eleusine coracana subsp. coracana TaxID=191504 RepID=A0AAV5G1H2_ELECO|nr:hypothetical protein PR202_gn00423 [Eleusine coracana subsp. coracana]
MMASKPHLAPSPEAKQRLLKVLAPEARPYILLMVATAKCGLHPSEVSMELLLADKAMQQEGNIEKGDEQVKVDALRIGQYKGGEIPTDSKELATRLFYTVYMGTENSSEDTRSRAKRLAEEIGSFHLDVPIDSIVSAFLSLFETLTGKRPRYKVDGGANTENLGLQNIQARIRMVLAFMMASLMPWVHNKSGFYLVLGSSNVGEGLRGNDNSFSFAKYDCSSADINPIGSISKQDLRAFLRWAAIHLKYSSLAEVESAPPTAELEPIRTNYNQQLVAVSSDMAMANTQITVINTRLDGHATRIACTEQWRADWDDGLVHSRPPPGGTPSSSSLASNSQQMPKPNFLCFDGESDPIPWLNKCESYFHGVGTLEAEKFWLAALHLDGVAVEWFLALDCDNLQLPWADFIIYVNLTARFSAKIRWPN